MKKSVKVLPPVEAKGINNLYNLYGEDEEEIEQNLLGVCENSIQRIDLENTAHKNRGGLLVRNLTGCVAIILESNDEKRKSLCHHDNAMADPESILNEITSFIQSKPNEPIHMDFALNQMPLFLGARCARAQRRIISCYDKHPYLTEEEITKISKEIVAGTMVDDDVFLPEFKKKEQALGKEELGMLRGGCLAIKRLYEYLTRHGVTINGVESHKDILAEDTLIAKPFTVLYINRGGELDYFFEFNGREKLIPQPIAAFMKSNSATKARDEYCASFLKERNVNKNTIKEFAGRELYRDVRYAQILYRSKAFAASSSFPVSSTSSPQLFRQPRVGKDVAEESKLPASRSPGGPK